MMTVLGMEFVWIPAGEFWMGSPENEPGRSSSETRHRVRLTKGFYMQTTPVTQGQWKAVMGNNPSRFCGDDCPVENVSWNDAQEFLKKLNARGEGTYRLPTEAQWEYACRAGTEGAFCNGPITDPLGRDPNLDKVGWFNENSEGTTHPVGQKRPNTWGLHDMHGNVWEWCADWFGDYPDDGPVTDPTGPSTGSGRVRRGGSWLNSARNCRSANRSNYSPGDRSYILLGFRLVMDVGPEPEKLHIRGIDDIIRSRTTKEHYMGYLIGKQIESMIDFDIDKAMYYLRRQIEANANQEK